MTPAPLTRESLNAQAYQRLSLDLKSGRFRPGEKLKLRALAEEFGISVTPVREAMARLISEQALQQVDHHSVCVPVMDQERYLEIRDLRLYLEGHAAEVAATLATPADVKRMAAIHKRMVEYWDADEVTRALAENELFHIELCVIAQKPVLQRIVEGLWLQCGPLMTALPRAPGINRGAKHPHLMVLRGLKTRDPDMAREGLRHDILQSSQPIIDYLTAQREAEKAA
jgi:DNA-binding GntR family transcriptional regulator